MQFFHVTLIGLSARVGHQVLLTLALVAALFIARFLIFWFLRLVSPGEGMPERFRFWTDQGVNVLCAIVLVFGLISIWVGRSAHLATVGGLLGAGVAFALQKFIISIAAYVVILRGKTFNVGDRVIIGGVRGEVIALDFFQTTVLEMGQPPSIEEQTDPAVWVLAR